MKLRIAFLSVLFLFLAGAVLAVPTAGEAPSPDAAAFLAAWDIDSPVTDGYALASPAPAQEPTELAIYGPCGCTPMPGCPFPIPWPGPTFPFPFPLPGPCPCPPLF